MQYRRILGGRIVSAPVENVSLRVVFCRDVSAGRKREKVERADCINPKNGNPGVE